MMNNNTTLNGFDNIKDFAKYIEENIVRYLPYDYSDSEVCVNEVIKTNGEMLTGLNVKLVNKNVAPVVYINKSFEEYLKGMSLVEIMSDLANAIIKANENRIDINSITKFENVMDSIYYKLISYPKNIEYLKDKVFDHFLDLAKVYYIDLSDDHNGTMTATITKPMLTQWGVTREKVIDHANYNVTCELESFRSMTEIMKEILPFDDPEVPETGLYVLTNESKTFGARKICQEAVRNLISCTLNSDYIVIPSSIHEVIIVAANDESDFDQINEMIQTVNAEQVELKDQLSDHAYYVRSDDNSIKMI